MGFFFSKHKKAKAVKGPRPAKSTKQNAEILHRLGCSGCPLDKADVHTPKMQPTIATETLVYFLAEAPGQDEDEKSGRPLTGPSGKLLRECIPKGDEKYCSFDNVVRDRPPKNRTPTWQEIECCRQYVVKSIEETKPKLIVGLGAISLSWALGSTDMAGMRGRVFAIKVGNHQCWFLPTYHPSFILRIAFNKQKPLQSKMGHCFRMDIQKAFKLLDSLPPAKVDTEDEAKAGVQLFTTGAGIEPLMSMLEKARRAPLKAIDIETSTLRPYAANARILTVAISFDDTTFAFPYDHPKIPWGSMAIEALADTLVDILEDDTIKVAHNAPFEIEWFVQFLGRAVVNHRAWECSMMQAHFLDERRGKQSKGDDDNRRATYQSLDFLCKQHFGIPIKKLFKLDKANMADADLHETLLYNGVDSKYCLKLFKHQYNLLKQEGLLEAYREALPRQPTVALMQHIGIDVDQAEIKKAQEALNEELEGIVDEINCLKVVQDYIKDHKVFNPYGGPDALILFRDYLKRKEIYVTDKSGAERESTDKNVLDRIDHPLAELIVRLRNRHKMKSTYVDCFEAGKGAFIWPDGKLHTSFNTTFTVTGRTSCVASWTPVLTDKGYYPICWVTVGDWVLTHKGNWRKVKKVWLKGHAQMYDISFTNGAVLTCTKDHRVLLANGGWIAIEDTDVFKEMDFNSNKHGCSAKALPQQRYEISKANSTGTKYNRKQCLVGYPQVLGERRTQSTEDASLLCIQNGGKEPNDGENFRKTSWMERLLRGWLWLSNNKNRNRTNLSSSASSNERTWIENYKQGLGNSPYRWGQSKQQQRQSCFGYQSRAQRNTQTATSGFSLFEIKEIKVSGSYEVFDITVEGDGSYLSCGIFSHNSDEPNQQNWPKRNDSWVRKTVVPPKGHVLVAFDYGQLEACTSAMCSMDKVLVKALWEDYDIHMEWTHKLVEVYPLWIGGSESLEDKATARKYRSIVKNKLVFPAIFGASNKSLSIYLKTPEDKVEKLMKEFWGTFGDLKDWQDRLMKGYYNDGYVTSPTGRRHNYPLTRNEAINFPIQSVAADIVCDAMNVLSEEAVVTGDWYMHPVLNIHDDLSFVIPDDDDILDKAIRRIYKVMLTPTYDFINVPLSVECSVGNNWYEMKEIGKFWSHKDDEA